MEVRGRTTVRHASDGDHSSRRKLSLRPRLSRLPPFGLVSTFILAGALIPTFLIYHYEWGCEHRSVGIEVRLLKPGPLKAATDFRTIPLTVRIQNAGYDSAPRFYLNSRPVALEALRPLLKAELKSRAEWVVYVEADSDVNWGDAVSAMDIIRASGGEVDLLTTEPALRTHSFRQRRH